MTRVNRGAEAAPDKLQATGADKTAFVERLQTILANWPSADRLARAMGVSPSAFRKWLKGEAEPSRERLVALAHVAGVGVGWLAKGEGPAPTFEPMAGNRRRAGSREFSPEIDPAQFLLLPHRPAAAAAGSVTPSRPAETEWLALRHDWLRANCNVEPSEVVLEIASGESMAPTIRNGNTLLIDTTDRTFRSFGIYVLEINGNRLVKRVQRKHDGTLVLINDNLTYQPDVVDKIAAADIAVVGRVVWSGGAL